MRAMTRTDAELLIASRDDPRAFRELYDRWADRLLAYFYRRVLDAEVAGDLLAETFAVAFERRRRFRDVGAPGAAWLYGIADKELAHWFRKQDVERRAIRRLAIEVPPLDDESIARIEALADMDAHRSALAAALDQIGPGERDAVQLRVVEEMGYAEIASRLDCTRGGRARARAPRPGPTEPPDGGRLMSEIPFVKALGDELERRSPPAAAASAAGSLRRRRLRDRRHRRRPPPRASSAPAGAARHDRHRLLHEGRPRALRRLGALATRNRSPVEACRREHAHRRAPLVACAAPPARGRPPRPAAPCEKLGLEPLPPGVRRRARAGAEARARGSRPIEETDDCCPARPARRARPAAARPSPAGRGWRRRGARRPWADGPVRDGHASTTTATARGRSTAMVDSRTSAELHRDAGRRAARR